MRVLLINPNRDYYNKISSVSLGPPLGLLYIASSLIKHGADIEILDCLSSPKTSVRRTFRRTFVGLSEPEIRAEIRARKPDIVGIGCPFTTQWDNASDCIRLVHEEAPGATLVVGGPHASAEAEYILNGDPRVDYVIAGEGEWAMCKLFDCLSNGSAHDLTGIPGLVWRDTRGAIVANEIKPIENLDELPLPAYHLIDIERYFEFDRIGYSSRRSAKRALPLITSRGCPYRCVFCSIRITMGRKWRRHSVDYVVDHLHHLVNVLKVEHLHIEDDNFTFRLDRAEAICLRLVEEHFNITWDAPNGVRADKLDEAFLTAAKRSGCTGLRIAAEVGDQNILNQVIHKRISLASIVRAAKLCRKLNIRLGCFFVIGVPGETKKSIAKTMALADALWSRCHVFPHVHLAAPLPGTELEHNARKLGYLFGDITPTTLAYSIAPRGRGLIKTADFSPTYLKWRCLLFYYGLFVKTLFTRLKHIGRFSAVSHIFRLI